MKAELIEPEVTHDITFWDGKEGTVGLTPITPVDDKPRAMIYNTDGDNYTLFAGDAIIAHIHEGKIVKRTSMPRELALATFKITELPIEDDAHLLPAESDAERVTLPDAGKGKKK